MTTPKKTLAAILTKLQSPLVLDTIYLPSKLECGQVLVKIHYSTICGAQINEIDGAKGPDKYLPHLLGHEGSGEVVEIGPAVTRLSKGNHVVLHWRQASGIQSTPPLYKWRKQTVNAGWVTTFQEYAVISENRLTKIPSEFDMKLAPLFGCAVTSALGVINNDAKLKIGQSIVIIGVGGVGLNIIQGASIVGGFPIIAIDLYHEKLRMAKKFGATHTINSKNNAHLESDLKKI